MKAVVLSILGVIGFFALIFALTWGDQANEYGIKKGFGIKNANLDRQIFEESYSYNRGMIQDLQNLQIEYRKAEFKHDTNHMDLVSSMVVHRFAGFSEDKLPYDLYQFIQEMKTKQVQR